jgi:hypothetical protein
MPAATPTDESDSTTAATDTENATDATHTDGETDATHTESATDATATATTAYEPTIAPLGAVSESHQTVVGPPSLDETPTALRTGATWMRGLWVGEFPDAPPDGLLETLYAAPESRRTDIAIHLTPRDTQRTLDSLENKLEDLEADHEYLTEKRRAGARGTRKDLDDYREVYDTLRNTSMRAFDVAMYAAVRGDDRSTLDATTDAVTGLARHAPANLTPITPRWTQRDSLVSASPVAVDALSESFTTTTPMLGRAVGALFPFVAGSFAEDGIEYGTYALNESPLILDRFARETGYCTMVIGKLGAGKSFATKLQLVRRAMYDPETIIVLLDPLEGFAGVNDALGGERITVGGTRGFNPLDLQPTPDDVLLAAPDIDPWSEQIAWVLSFFETFFTHVATNPLSERRQTLRRAVQEAYERQGIRRDPATHTNPSPTVRDVIAVLEAMLEAPAEFGYPTDGERESVQADAQSLLKDLRPSFREGGDLANLAKPTAFDLDASVIYLDLHQEEGTRGRSETSLMMQVLFNAVYERAKGTDKRVIFCIDEAHYLLGDATALGFLETAVRHSRHYNLSVQFITQTGGEFALTPEARTIANLCSMRLIHRVDEAADELAEWFGLSDREVNWVRTATAGNDNDGYSEALLGIDEEGWFPLRVRASPYEAAVISGESPEQSEHTADGAAGSERSGVSRHHGDVP